MRREVQVSFEAHFTLAELTRSAKAKELGIENEPPEHVVRNLRWTMAGMERVRYLLGGYAIKILSGYRCPTLNLAVGGQEKSQHIQGLAVDFTCKSFGDPRQVATKLSSWVRILGIDQLILEEGWVHVSFSQEPRGEVLTRKSGQWFPGIA